MCVGGRSTGLCWYRCVYACEQECVSVSYLYVSSESGILYSALSASLRTCQVGMSYSTATSPQGLRAFHCHSLGLLVSPPWPEPGWSHSWGPAGHPTTRQMHEGQESQKAAALVWSGSTSHGPFPPLVQPFQPSLWDSWCLVETLCSISH